MITQNGNGVRRGDAMNVGTLSVGEEFERQKTIYAEQKYRSATRNRFTRDMTGTAQQGSSADYHVSNASDFYFLSELAYDIDRNDIIAGPLVDRVVANVLQDGFQLEPASGEQVADAYIREKWDTWAEDPLSADYQKESSFHEIMRQSYRSDLVAGDHFLLPLFNGSLQQIELHRGRTPTDLPGDRLKNTIHGVELNGARQRVRYHFTADDIALNETVDQSKTTARRAFDADGNYRVFHIRDPKRSTQTRGITSFKGVIEAFGMHDDVQFAKLVQQQSVSCWVMVLKKILGGNFPTSQQATAYREERCDPGKVDLLQNIAPGMIMNLLEGEEVSGFSPNVPNPTFFDHAKQIISLIGVNLGLPFVMAMLDASETNFSGHRAAYDEAKKTFRVTQDRLRDQGHKKTFAFKMRQWVNPAHPEFDPFLYRWWQSGVLVFRHEWIYPAWNYIEPLKDITADVLEVAQAHNSPRRVQARRGRRWEKVYREIVEDNGDFIVAAKSRAQEINQEFPDDPNPCTWQHLISLPTPDNVSLSISEMIENENASANAAPVGNAEG